MITEYFILKEVSFKKEEPVKEETNLDNRIKELNKKVLGIHFKHSFGNPETH